MQEHRFAGDIAQQQTRRNHHEVRFAKGLKAGIVQHAERETSGRLGNLEYQKTFGVSKPTATRDLEDMVRKGVLEKIGTTGKGTHYILDRKGLTKGSKGSKGSMGSMGS